MNQFSNRSRHVCSLRFSFHRSLFFAVILASFGIGQRALACPSAGYTLSVNVGNHRLILCEWGKVTKAFRISVGWGGKGKHKEGDHKTPVGTYALGPPRRSSSFSVFIPIGYPTKFQKLLGFTGGSVGVHGPPRLGTSYDPQAAEEDWTEGCLALSTDHDITELASWVARRNPTTISIQ